MKDLKVYEGEFLLINGEAYIMDTSKLVKVYDYVLPYDHIKAKESKWQKTQRYFDKVDELTDVVNKLIIVHKEIPSLRGITL